jgi:hypothetical protein
MLTPFLPAVHPLPNGVSELVFGDGFDEPPKPHPFPFLRNIPLLKGQCNNIFHFFIFFHR